MGAKCAEPVGIGQKCDQFLALWTQNCIAPDDDGEMWPNFVKFVAMPGYSKVQETVSRGNRGNFCGSVGIRISLAQDSSRDWFPDGNGEAGIVSANMI